MPQYRRDELADVAPWVAEEVDALELDIASDEAHALPEWIDMVTSNHSEIWHALQMQG